MNKLIFKIKDKYKKINEFFVMNPHRHWIIFLYIFSVITLCLIIFSFYLFFQIKNQQAYESISAESNKRIVLKEKLLKEVIDSFDKKASKTIELKKGTGAGL